MSAALVGVGLGALWALARHRPVASADAWPDAPLKGRAPQNALGPGAVRRSLATLTSSARRPPPAFVTAFQAVPAPFDEQSDLVAAYNAQERNPLWAPKMEAELRKHLAEKSPASVGLPDLEVDVTECRDGTCRLDIKYPEALMNLPIPPGYPSKRPGPFGIYLFKAGRFMTSINETPPTRGPDGREVRTAIIGFKASAIDPDHFQEWLAAHPPGPQGSTPEGQRR